MRDAGWIWLLWIAQCIVAHARCRSSTFIWDRISGREAVNPRPCANLLRRGGRSCLHLACRRLQPGQSTKGARIHYVARFSSHGISDRMQLSGRPDPLLFPLGLPHGRLLGLALNPLFSDSRIREYLMTAHLRVTPSRKWSLHRLILSANIEARLRFYDSLTWPSVLSTLINFYTRF